MRYARRRGAHAGLRLRTLVFFKGCLLACLWCSSPESQRFGADSISNIWTPSSTGSTRAATVNRIVSNLRLLATSGACVAGRVPVVPDFNDSPEDIRSIADQVVSLGIRELHLLPYHRLGQNKYRLLGRNCNFMGSRRLPRPG